jgi:hypothetical protein
VLGRERGSFAGRHVVVVGAGHSAANTLLNLAALADEEPGTRITWVIRNATAQRVTTSPDDELQARATIGVRVDELVAAGRIHLVDRFEIVGPRAGRRGCGCDGGAASKRGGAASVRITGRRGDGLDTIDATAS